MQLLLEAGLHINACLEDFFIGALSDERVSLEVGKNRFSYTLSSFPYVHAFGMRHLVLCSCPVRVLPFLRQR